MRQIKDEATKSINFLGSMKFGLALLFLIGVTSTGATWLQISFSQTWWFRILATLLAVNIAFCTWRRGKGVLSPGRHTSRVFVRTIALVILHAGFLCILLGVLVFSFWGRSGVISLAKGETAQVSSVLGPKWTTSIKLDDFQIDTDPSGSPVQYTSRITLLDVAKSSGSFDISVNHPLIFQGMKIYQEGYDWAVAAVSGNKSNPVNGPVTLQEGDLLAVSGTRYKIRFYQFIPDYDGSGDLSSLSPQPLNPRVVYSIYAGDSMVNVGLARLGQDIRIGNGVLVRFISYEPVSTLTVKHDPGVPLVLIGACMLVLGVGMALYFSHDTGGEQTLKQQTPASGDPGRHGTVAEHNAV